MWGASSRMRDKTNSNYGEEDLVGVAGNCLSMKSADCSQPPIRSSTNPTFDYPTSSSPISSAATQGWCRQYSERLDEKENDFPSNVFPSATRNSSPERHFILSSPLRSATANLKRPREPSPQRSDRCSSPFEQTCGLDIDDLAFASESHQDIGEGLNFHDIGPLSSEAHCARLENVQVCHSSDMSRLRLGLSIHQALTSREIFQNAQTRLFQPSLRNYAKNFVSTENDMYQVKTEYGGISPPFTCAYANTTYGGKCLAVADEDGTIGLLDTRHGAAHELEVPRTKWTAHNNAVFDICWAANDQQLMSAAGDQTARVWDVETQKCLSVFSGHNCSIKSVASNGRNPFVFATAARDGKIMTWDTRCNGITVRDVDSHRATDTIKNAHQNICAAPSKDRSKKRSRRQLSAQARPSQSVTCVRYWTNNETMLISSGSADGLLKIWDLRNHSTHFRKEFPTPFATSTLAAGKRRSHGISSFAVDSRGCRVYATCTAGIVSEYDLNNLQCPIRSFSATTFRVSSFYVKTTISPDDQFVATGSSDSGLYIWDTKCHPLRQDKPPLILRSHLSEVTGVSWSKTDLEELGSCSDDSTIRVWQIKPDYVEKDQDSRFESLRGHVEEGELREIRGQGN